MKEILERAVNQLADITPEEFQDGVNDMTNERYREFLTENGLDESQLWYWNDSGITPVYMYTGTMEELRGMYPPQGCLFTEEILGNGERRWNLSVIADIFDIPVTVVLLYISLESELQ